MKKNYTRKSFAILILFFSMVINVLAYDINNGVTVTNGYIKPNIPGSDITAAYMEINNKGDKSITLQKVTGNLSNRIEIHEHTMAEDMMRMRKVDHITINANSSVLLQPSGLHLMVFSLKKTLNEKESVNLTLHFSNNTKLNIQLPVYRYK